ncbi:hypothetical protein D3C71_1544890 [compost metagenome]
MQPCVNALGKKYSTTGPPLSAAAMSNGCALPARADCVVNTGAVAPTANAACAGAASHSMPVVASTAEIILKAILHPFRTVCTKPQPLMRPSYLGSTASALFAHSP